MHAPMRIVRCAFVFAAGLTPVLAGATTEARTPRVGSPTRDADDSFDAGAARLSCGPTALYIWLRLLGHDVAYDEVSRCVPVARQGTSLAQLAEGARRWTRGARVLRVSPDEIERLRLPVIAHGRFRGQTSNEGHYVVVVKVTPVGAVCIDAGRGLRVEIAKSDFAAFSSGYVLTQRDTLASWNRQVAILALGLGVLYGSRAIWRFLCLRRSVAGAALVCLFGCGCRESSAPRLTGPEAVVPATAESPLVSDGNYKDLGIVLLGESARAVFTLSNVTDSPLDLSLGRPSCGCLSARLSARRLEPSGCVELTLVLSEAGEGCGKIGGEVMVGVVGSDHMLFFRAQGIVEGMRTEPYVLRLPTDLAGFSPEAIRGEIILGPDRRGADVRITDVALNDPLALKKQEGNHLLDLGPPIVREVEDFGTHLRRRFEIPLALARTNDLGARMFEVRVTYRVGDRSAHHHLRLPMFPEATDSSHNPGGH